MHSMTTFLRRFRRNEAGVALIEFAMVFPFFALLIFGGIEISRLILIQQKLEKSGYVIADIVSQYDPPTITAAAGELSMPEVTTNVFPILGRIMSPYNNNNDQVAILTSIRKRSNGAMDIRWQAAGAGTLTGCDSVTPQTCARSVVNSKTAAQVNGDGASVRGQAPAFPADISGPLAGFRTSADNLNFIVSEVFFFYRPMLQSLLQGVGEAGGTGMAGFRYFVPQRIYVKRTFFVPRKGPLFDLPPTFPCCS